VVERSAVGEIGNASEFDSRISKSNRLVVGSNPTLAAFYATMTRIGKGLDL
jgi:hypothetical protein